MSLQRQHFFLSYLNTLSVTGARICPLPSPAPIRNRPQYQGLRPLILTNIASLTSHSICSRVLRRGLRFIVIIEKTRKSNRSQMSLQRQHFFLSYLNTLSVGPAEVCISGVPLGRPALPGISSRLSS